MRIVAKFGMLAGVVLAGLGTSCVSYRRVPPSEVPAARRIRVRLPIARSFTFRCDTAGPIGHTVECAGDSLVLMAPRELDGTMRMASGDSILMAVASYRDSANSEIQFKPARVGWIPRDVSVVEERHGNPVGTTALVLVIVGVLAVITIAASYHPPPATPKPSSPPPSSK